MGQTYPFGDDVLFRGNAATLEFLDIVLDREMVAMVRQRNVFTPISHPKLQCVNIKLRPYDTLDVFTTSDYWQFALSIASRASALALPSLLRVGSTFTTKLAMLGNHDRLQVLSLYRGVFSLWDVVNLIKLLPFLSDLKTGDPTMDELPQDANSARLPEYARSTYAPMGKRFRCWHITYSWSPRFGNLAACVLVLALICPNFDYVALSKAHREPFMEAMKEKIAEPGFIQYAPRLRRLLFDGWNDC
ncbi:hypothetical protein GGI00_000448 [Coemansia sp. RSA 2681]|nr:hypothetical protein GGI00_000448 [Coemansia sp. RSA 2681]